MPLKQHRKRLVESDPHPASARWHCWARSGTRRGADDRSILPHAERSSNYPSADACVRHQAPVSKGAAAASRVSRDVMWRVVASLVITIIASSTTFNAVTVALPNCSPERMDALAGSPGAIGAIAAAAYVFGALAHYTIGNLLDRCPFKVVSLPLSFALAPLLFISAGSQGVALLPAGLGVIVGIFGQVTLQRRDGRQVHERRMACARLFGALLRRLHGRWCSVGLVAWLHQRGGFELMLQAFGMLCLLVIAGALIFPTEQPPGFRRNRVALSSPVQANSLEPAAEHPSVLPCADVR